MVAKRYRAESQHNKRLAKNSRRSAKWRQAGRELKRFRLEKGMAQKEFLQKLEPANGQQVYSDGRYIRKIERGEGRPTRCHLTWLLTIVFELNDFQSVDRILSLYGYSALTGPEARHSLLGGNWRWLATAKVPKSLKGAFRTFSITIWKKDGTSLLKYTGGPNSAPMNEGINQLG